MKPLNSWWLVQNGIAFLDLNFVDLDSLYQSSVEEVQGSFWGVLCSDLNKFNKIKNLIKPTLTFNTYSYESNGRHRNFEKFCCQSCLNKKVRFQRFREFKVSRILNCPG